MQFGILPTITLLPTDHSGGPGSAIGPPSVRRVCVRTMTFERNDL